MTTSPYLAAGFSAAVTASSANPEQDGYVAEFGGYGYHIHPTATPDQWELLTEALADGSATASPYVAPVITLEQAMADLRIARDLALSASDWTQMPDVPFTAAKKAEWATYRQALRDLPDTHASDPAEAVFPTAPA